MKLNLSLVSVLTTFVNGGLAAGHLPRSANCDVSQAYSILESLSTGKSYCSSYIHVSGVSTKTKTDTVTISGQCSITTKIKTVHATFTTT
jgi:hypothetical protein